MAYQRQALREMALFAGAGGGILGGKLLGWECVCAVEWEPYPAAVLAARQNEGILPPFPIWDDVRTFDGKPWRGLVDVVSGGFPCQDISSAGKGAGITGERSGMWSEMARIIGEVQPRFAFVENSPMLTSRGLDRVLGDLSTLGYDAEWGVVGADDAGAPHRRERIWILAYTNPNRDGYRNGSHDGRCDSLHGQNREAAPKDAGREDGINGTCPIGNNPIGQLADPDVFGCLHGQAEERTAIGGIHAQREPQPSGEDVADATSIGQPGPGEYVRPIHSAPDRNRQADRANDSGEGNAGWWLTEPGLGRVAHGVAARVDRLKAIGNGQVPAVVRLAWHTLHERLMNRNELKV